MMTPSFDRVQRPISQLSTGDVVTLPNDIVPKNKRNKKRLFIITNLHDEKTNVLVVNLYNGSTLWVPVTTTVTHHVDAMVAV